MYLLWNDQDIKRKIPDYYRLFRDKTQNVRNIRNVFLTVSTFHFRSHKNSIFVIICRYYFYILHTYWYLYILHMITKIEFLFEDLYLYITYSG